MADPPKATWTEADSREFLGLADVAIPRRKEQMDVLLSLLPAREDEPFTFTELGSGECLLAARVLARFPHSRYTGFDGSETMRKQAAKRLRPFGDRAELRDLDLHAMRWPAALPAGLRCVYASLTLHHLPDTNKPKAFAAIAERLEPGGALLIADIVAPPNETVRLSWAATWDAIMRDQSLEQTGTLDTYHASVKEGWNCHALLEPQPGEYYGDLHDQLAWLRDAGFTGTGCFWLRAGIAIYGGYR